MKIAIHNCFPSGYPGESFYSICVRYCARMRLSWTQCLGSTLGSAKEMARWDLPHSLAVFAQTLPPWNVMTLRHLISHHTLYGFYRHFMDTNGLRNLKEFLYYGTTLNCDGLFAWLTGHLLSESYLKYCRVCVGEDRQKYGETYWHRAHQIPGVRTCWKHRVFLVASTCHVASKRFQLLEPCVAEEMVGEGDTVLVDDRNMSHVRMCFLTDLAVNLLVRDPFHCSVGYQTPPFELTKRYVAALAEWELKSKWVCPRQLASYFDKVKWIGSGLSQCGSLRNALDLCDKDLDNTFEVLWLSPSTVGIKQHVCIVPRAEEPTCKGSDPLFHDHFFASPPCRTIERHEGDSRKALEALVHEVKALAIRVNAVSQEHLHDCVVSDSTR